MVKSHAGAKGGKAQPLAVRCATIPGNMRAQRHVAHARTELEHLVAGSHGGILGTATKPDPMGWKYIVDSHCGFKWPKFWKLSCGAPIGLVACTG